ncbi:MAG: hypothetical protein OXG92_12655 [Chloroflexi bacterium]|nr:hypothetical protein [Chloroflexota bacterium]MCY3581452.1 hypothetical protein [Chloroflexota bacterium]MCY3717303.1 hypothetical protein [Chloroflexota bacterium]MDE2649220.1 hypothetical protein [Chloroflexota bacterium]MXX83208.1 hypothetical protein [Chloroflexota bacterium]
MVNKPRSPVSLALLVIFLCAGVSGAMAQRASATPVPAVLVRATAEVAPVNLPRPTLPPPTIVLAPARLSALPSAGEVNARALPDVESELLGTIVSGTAYPALRNYFRWYEFRYDLSPSGTAWVYGDLVELEGDLSQIQVIDDFSAIASGNADDSSLVEDRTIELATAPANSAESGAVLASTPLPTFTPPSVTQSPGGSQLRIVASDAPSAPTVPPILPILALGGLGILGLLISLLRA